MLFLFLHYLHKMLTLARHQASLCFVSLNRIFLAYKDTDFSHNTRNNVSPHLVFIEKTSKKQFLL